MVPVTGCPAANEYNGNLLLRVSSLFVILVCSTFGACFPVFAYRKKSMGMPSWVFFGAKYFGSGVIIATAFIHLLAPAQEALGDPCLTGSISEYPWVEGIALMTIFVLFFVELMTMRYAKFGTHDHDHDHDSDHAPESGLELRADKIEGDGSNPFSARRQNSSCPSHVLGEDHLGHSRDHTDNEDVSADWQENSENTITPEAYAAQLTAVFILEFGIIFHSVFIGLTLAVAGAEFVTLYIVLTFHQTFEGLGLGSRLATIPWPKSKRWTPYLLGMAYGLSTPIAIAIGLGVRNSYAPGSQTTLIVNGVFDSISAGVLIYTGLVELMAHEFMFSNEMTKAPISTVLSAFGLMCAGAALMALLGKWA